MIGTGTGVNNSARAYAKAMGNQGDDAGHILAKILGGQGGKGNVFPQLSSINRGRFRTFEEQIRDKILDGSGPLNLKWRFEYSGSGTRPTKVIYDVYQNGSKILTDIFPIFRRFNGSF